jgi:hypothetical protein
MNTQALNLSRSQALRIEGGLFGPDLLEALARGELPGQKPEDFRLPPRRNLTEEIASLYHDARSLWQVFQHRLERLPEGDLATSETRELWTVPLLRLLGYDLHFSPRAKEVDGLTFAISHYAGAGEHAPPVHLVGYRQELGKPAPSGRPRLSPHALVQEYLNRSEALWGLVTNGRTLRLLRDSTFVRRQAYVEFDLEDIFEEERFADFVLLYRLLHRTRLPGDGRAEECLLERYYQNSLEQGGRVRERLREGVEQCIEILANGFLGHPVNESLRAGERESLRAGERESGRARERESASLALSSSHALTLYQQLLRLVYRFLFLLVSEERGLMGRNPLYLESYGVTRLRRLCENRAAYTDDVDLWLGLRALWEVFRDEKLAAILGAPPLNGELFAEQALDVALIRNRDLLSAFWHLAFYEEKGVPRRVNYAALDTEELGSVYESLLDYHPVITVDSTGKPHFELAPGSERKATGSYYTPPQLVGELIHSALEPVIAERLRAAEDEVRKAGEEAASRALPSSRPQALENALLSIKVCDPACGSGHFLLAAARRLGKELARIRTGEDEPAPEQVRAAIRDVVAHCIYGVDKNPLAVELCRVALWIESHGEGKPLTFLDHRIRCGDSLIGVFDLSALEEGVPDDAFNPLQGDDRRVASSLKRQNKAEREGQMALFDRNLNLDLSGLAQLGQELDAIPDDSPEQVRRKRERYEARWSDPALRRQKQACDLWTAAFFQSLTPSPGLTATPFPSPNLGRRGVGVRAITTDVVRRALAGEPIEPQTLAEAEVLAQEARFFHWPLEFPEVFAPHPAPPAPSPLSQHWERGEGVAARPGVRGEGGGFDVVLANPPWERIKLQEQEFFASRDARIAKAPNAAARKRLIERLPQENPALWEEYRRALHAAESASRFLRGSGAYPLAGRGDINTYSVFAERIRALLAPRGRAGVIVPTGVATDATNQHFFADLVEKGQIVCLFDFENREKLFPAVDSRMKFCLLTLHGPHSIPRPDGHPLPLSQAWERGRGPGGRGEGITLSFFATRVEHLRDPRRVFTLTPEDIARINPNTRTLPVFRTRQDAELTKAIYARVPVLVNEARGESAWLVNYRQGLFHSSNDATLFNPNIQSSLTQRGGYLFGNEFFMDNTVYSPLYEGRMIGQYDHRFGTYADFTDRASTSLPTPDERQHADPHFVVLPWYWVSAAEVQARLGEWKRGWLLGFRDVCRSTDERTAIFSLLPRVGVGDQLGLLFFDEKIESQLVACLLANANCLVFDYAVRQKVGGVHLKKYVLYQLPVLPPTAYTAADLRFIVPRVLELTYTAWDLAPFAADVWNDADEALRAAIWAQRGAAPLPTPPAPSPLSQAWERGEGVSPQATGERGEGIPFPPFVWNEERRARLRAELDAYYARLYGLTRKQLRYILDPADLTERELEEILDPWEEVADPLDPQGYAERAAKSDFPGETFRVLKEKELREFGEYRTRRLALEAWERMREPPD